MEILEVDVFKNILKNVDFNNEYDFETFYEELASYCDMLSESNIEEINEYLENELGVSSDSDLHGLSTNGISKLCKLINQLLD